MRTSWVYIHIYVWRHFWTKRQICTKDHFFTASLLHEGSLLNEDTFARVDFFLLSLLLQTLDRYFFIVHVVTRAKLTLRAKVMPCKSVFVKKWLFVQKCSFVHFWNLPIYMCSKQPNLPSQNKNRQHNKNLHIFN